MFGLSSSSTRLPLSSLIAAIALLGFFGFPGHTYLHSDTQIYVPMLEHIRDPAAYPNDLVATKPHLSFTIYDEVALGLRGAVGAPFEFSLIAQQLLFRTAQAGGIFLLASALPVSVPMALAVAAIAGLGATINGPAVLLLEFEPVPRGFAIGLIFLAIGLAARGWPVLASVAGSLAFLYHAPTTIPFWMCFLPLVLWRRQWRALLPLAVGIAVIAVAAALQLGVAERQHFFFQNDLGLERLQRMRAPYNWVSNWAGTLAWQYGLFCAASLLAFWRLRPQAGRVFLIGLPVIGLLSVPASYLLLERLRWGLMAQVQPARALLFVTAIALILSAAAAVRAGHWAESAAWFTLAFWIPAQGPLLLPIGLAACAAAGVRFQKTPVLALTLVAAYFVIPIQHPSLETPDLDRLAGFAREHTAKNAMFLFPDVGHGLQPGIFRARALRSVYVDWKAGGQVNYYKSLADEWWGRWRQCNALVYRADLPVPPEVDYVVLTKPRTLPGATPVYANTTFSVYLAKNQ